MLPGPFKADATRPTIFNPAGEIVAVVSSRDSRQIRPIVSMLAASRAMFDVLQIAYAKAATDSLMAAALAGTSEAADLNAKDCEAWAEQLRVVLASALER